MKRRASVFSKSDSKSIDRIFLEMFSKINDENVDFSSLITSSLIMCFHLKPSKKDRLLQAEFILTRMFFLFTKQISLPPFHLSSEFLTRYKINPREKKQLLIALIYGIYFGDIDLCRLRFQKKRPSVEFLMLQLAAETVSGLRLKKIMYSLSIDTQIRLISYVCNNYREGSYYILQELEAYYLSQSHKYPFKIYFTQLTDLIVGLRSHHFDRLHFQYLLDFSEIDYFQVDTIISKLTTHTDQQTQELYILFNELIPLIINSPIRGYQAFDLLKFSAKSNQRSKLEMKNALAQQEFLKKHFQGYLSQNFTLDDFKKFIKLFGMKGQFPLITLFGKPVHADSLLAKIRLLHRLFSEPYALPQLAPNEWLSACQLIQSISSHLNAICRQPNRIAKGLKMLVCAIPTNNKRLESLPALSSIIQGFYQVVKFHNESNHQKITLRDFPIFVFDQSECKIFIQNSQFIKQMNQFYESSIIHISRKNALILAQKIGVEDLLITTPREDFGFGGARNCVFLLTKVLKMAFKTGVENIEDVLKLNNCKLMSFFCNTLLDKTSSFLMIDDDMEIPSANIFAHALFALDQHNSFVSCCGICCGRATKYLVRFKNIDEILNKPKENFAHTQWLNVPFDASMPEYIGAPKICLNLPLGNEEAHLRLPKKRNPLLQSSYHMGGKRYPNKQIPTHHFVGLEDYLKIYLPYAMGISLSVNLIDPSNEYNRCILPWNDPGISDHFSCLNDCLTFMADKKIKREMQKKFWKNVHALFDVSTNSNHQLRQMLNTFLQMNIESTVKLFQMKQILSPHEISELAKLKKLYLFFQKDISLLDEFGQSLIQNLNTVENYGLKIAPLINQSKEYVEKVHDVHFEDHPITYLFYLLCRSVGGGDFSNIIATILTKAAEHR